ncbi:MerR family transcriptional regulator [Deinococcus rubellus]|uniref:MerR family transcriptional regulator n=2 Tax=Deinococcus rubellus TaxID=1889240 RepID=A0ABY5YM40_9DEIO|nr:B12-binding domain-containing protein [Deinococcus rubellus]UWX65407.1 MerR family transcriptional regulator [Deinococcus rubellus]
MTCPADSSGLFTASEVEARSGVPATTLRQWERRYGLPHPQRNASGYRLYSRRDVALIEFMRQRTEEGVPVSRAAELARQQFAVLGETPGDPALVLVAPPSSGHPEVSAPLAAQTLVDALIKSDLAGAERLLAEAQARINIEGVLMQLIQPALGILGERWERGEITVAHEHQASAFLRAQLTALLNAAGHSRFGPTVVAACGPQEQHELGLLMLSVVLRRLGVQVQYVGANTPLGDLVVYARSVGAQAILISINTQESLQAALLQRRDVQGQDIPVFVGGKILNAQRQAAAELGQWAGPDAVQAARTIVDALKFQERRT